MPTYTLPNFTGNSSGLSDIFIYTSQQVPFLPVGILIFVYIIIVAGGYFSQERKTGYGNFPMWMAIGGLITTFSSYLLFMIDGLVNLYTIIILTIITIISALWFLISKNE